MMQTRCKCVANMVNAVFTKLLTSSVLKIKKKKFKFKNLKIKNCQARKRDHIKMRDYLDRRVTLPIWSRSRVLRLLSQSCKPGDLRCVKV